jgi:hypothetical protein
VTVVGGNQLDGLWFVTWTILSRHGVMEMKVYIHVPKEKRKKLEPSGKKGTFGDTESLIWRLILRSMRL